MNKSQAIIEKQQSPLKASAAADFSFGTGLKPKSLSKVSESPAGEGEIDSSLLGKQSVSAKPLK